MEVSMGLTQSRVEGEDNVNLLPTEWKGSTELYHSSRLKYQVTQKCVKIKLFSKSDLRQ